MRERRIEREAFDGMKAVPAGGTWPLSSMPASRRAAQLHSVLEGRNPGTVLVDQAASFSWCVVRPAESRTSS
jgi:hypothetical protein